MGFWEYFQYTSLTKAAHCQSTGLGGSCRISFDIGSARDDVVIMMDEV